MSLRLTKAIAAVLIVLGVSPFTAPFSTCDLGGLMDVNHRGQPEGGAAIKSVTDPDESPVLAAAAPAALSSLFDLAPCALVAASPLLAGPQISHQILRI